MAKSSQLIVGIDLGGTNMQIGLVDRQNRIVGRAKKKTRAAEGGDRVIERMVDGVHEACQQAGVTVRQITAIGIGAPGAIDAKTGVVKQAPNLRWTDYPLARVMSRKLGHHVVVDNDVRSAIYGEWMLGVGKGVSDLLGVWIGTGIGGGLILKGELYHGFFNTAGEIGHTTLFPFAPPAGASLEDNCSRTAIVKRLLRLIETNHPSMITELAEGDLADVKAKVVATAYAKGDKVTRRVVENAAQMLGYGIANIITTLALPRVVLGGGLTEAMGESLVALVRNAVRSVVFPDVCKKVEILGTKLEADAGLLGAALLARKWVDAQGVRAAARKKK